jgi:hypothetical protein
MLWVADKIDIDNNCGFLVDCVACMERGIRLGIKASEGSGGGIRGWTVSDMTSILY